MINFTDDMKIGVPNIDAQHKSLVEFANKAEKLLKSNPTKEEMKEFLNFLGSYVSQHFSDEEALQIECKYPRYRQHKGIHQEFVQTFESLMEEFEKNGVSDSLSYALSHKVSSWIIMHIMKEDQAFGKFYTEFKLNQLKNHL